MLEVTLTENEVKLIKGLLKGNMKAWKAIDKRLENTLKNNYTLPTDALIELGTMKSIESKLSSI